MFFYVVIVGFDFYVDVGVCGCGEKVGFFVILVIVVGLLVLVVLCGYYCILVVDYC